MRMRSVLCKDMRYQLRYGFYPIYAFLTALYIGLLHLVPAGAKPVAAGLLLLSDPSVLGFFFIGGIWLLERDEGVHAFYATAPVLVAEYMLSKALSLGLISTLSAVAIAWASVSGAKLLLLGSGVFLSSCIFTTLGLWTATCAKSVNGYLLLAVPASVFIMAPPLLSALTRPLPVYELFPGTMAWRIIDAALTGGAVSWTALFGLALWLAVCTLSAHRRVSTALSRRKGGVGSANA